MSLLTSSSIDIFNSLTGEVTTVDLIPGEPTETELGGISLEEKEKILKAVECENLYEMKISEANPEYVKLEETPVLPAFVKVDITLTKSGCVADAHQTGLIQTTCDNLNKSIQPVLEDSQKLVDKIEEVLTIRDSNNNTIEGIQKIVQSGYAPLIYSIGDQIIVPWTSSNGNMYNFVWDVVNFGNVVREDGSIVPGMYLCSHYAVNEGIRFSQQQAFYLVSRNVLKAGTYNITIGEDYGAYCIKDKTYQFTLSKDVPVGGKLSGMYDAPDIAPSNWKVYSWADAFTQLEVVNMKEGKSGTNLGTMYANISSTNINSIKNTAYGNNGYENSTIIQYLNSDKPKGEWWVPKNPFDIRPNELNVYNGFLYGFDKKIVNSLSASSVITFKNIISDGGEKTVIKNKVFIPSLEEMYIEPEVKGEGESWAYFKQILLKSEPLSRDESNEYLIRYDIDEHTMGQNVYLRSAEIDSNNKIWSISSSGEIVNSNTLRATGFIPACILC